MPASFWVEMAGFERRRQLKASASEAIAVTIGEDRVRVKFNPSADGLVDQIKQKSAELIDLCEQHKGRPFRDAAAEQDRLWSLAQTHYEDAAMWAVKAATTPQK